MSGLPPDCVIINQIIGFVSFRARAIATFQAYLEQPIRWLPGLEVQSYADGSLLLKHQLAGVPATKWRNLRKSKR